jgi:hypothetical protein
MEYTLWIPLVIKLRHGKWINMAMFKRHCNSSTLMGHFRWVCEIARAYQSISKTANNAII